LTSKARRAYRRSVDDFHNHPELSYPEFCGFHWDHPSNRILEKRGARHAEVAAVKTLANLLNPGFQSRLCQLQFCGDATGRALAFFTNVLRTEVFR
jgi:hypothetical protein